MATIITLNMGKKLRPLHKLRRRKQASKIVRQEIARRLKLKQEDVKLSPALNRRIISYLVRKPRRLRMSVEVKEGKAKADLYVKEAEQKQASAEVAGQKNEKQRPEAIAKGPEAKQGAK